MEKHTIANSPRSNEMAIWYLATRVFVGGLYPPKGDVGELWGNSVDVADIVSGVTFTSNTALTY